MRGAGCPAHGWLRDARPKDVRAPIPNLMKGFAGVAKPRALPQGVTPSPRVGGFSLASQGPSRGGRKVRESRGDDVGRGRS